MNGFRGLPLSRLRSYVSRWDACREPPRHGVTPVYGSLLALGHVEVGDGALEGLGRHADRLGQGRVRVDGQTDVFGVRAHLDRQGRGDA